MTPKQEALYERNMKWRQQYEAGATLQQIADWHEGVVYLSTISKGIERVGGTIRPPGYRPGERNHRPKRGLLSWLNQPY